MSMSRVVIYIMLTEKGVPMKSGIPGVLSVRQDFSVLERGVP